MRVFFAQAIVGLQRVAVPRGLRFDMLAYHGLKRFLPALVHDFCSNLAATLKNCRDNRLALCPATTPLKPASLYVHVPQIGHSHVAPTPRLRHKAKTGVL